MTTILDAAISKRFDSARTLTLTLPDPNGRASIGWKVGDRVILYAGWNAVGAHPLFEGVVPPNGIRASAAGAPVVRIFAVDFIALLEQERIVINPSVAKAGTDETTYGGWEAGAAARDLVETSRAITLVPNADAGGMKGSSPARIVGVDVAEPSGSVTRGAMLRTLVAGMVDDETTPDRPVAYHYWVSTRSVSPFEPRVYLQRERDAAVDPIIRTIDTSAEWAAVGVEQRSDQATSAVAMSSSDPTLWSRFEDDEAVTRYGRLEAGLAMATKNTDDLDALARRTVRARRYPVRSLVVTVRDGFRHELNQVVQVKDRILGTGTYLVTSVDIRLGPTEVHTTLRLSAPEELLSEVLG